VGYLACQPNKKILKYFTFKIKNKIEVFLISHGLLNRVTYKYIGVLSVIALAGMIYSWATREAHGAVS